MQFTVAFAPRVSTLATWVPVLPMVAANSAVWPVCGQHPDMLPFVFFWKMHGCVLGAIVGYGIGIPPNGFCGLSSSAAIRLGSRSKKSNTVVDFEFIISSDGGLKLCVAYVLLS